MTDQLDDMDLRIRDDLLGATEHMTETDVGRLTVSLVARRERTEARNGSGNRRERAGGRGVRWLSAAAILVVVSGVIGALVLADRSSTPRAGQKIRTSPGTSTTPHDVDQRPQETDGLDYWEDWEPGWHELDLGPVPRGGTYSTAWYRGRLIVAANDFTVRGGLGWSTRMWAYDPRERSWTEMPVPDLYRIDIVAAGDQLVAVGVPDSGEPNAVVPLGNRWATWAMGDDSWNERGPLPRAPQLEATGVAPVDADGSPLLVWTGKALLDFTRGQVMVPGTGEIQPLALPDDLMEFRTFLSTRPVWTGSEVVWPDVDAGSGLVWSPRGDHVRSAVFTGDVDRPEPNRTGGAVRLTSNVFTAGGRVIVVNAYSGGDPYTSYGEVVAIDPAAGRSTRLERIDDLSVPGCLIGATVDDQRLLVVPCARDDRSADAMLLDGDRWLSTGTPPDATHLANAARQPWIMTAGRSAVLSSALVPGDWVQIDRSGDEWVPKAAIWIPDR